MIIAKEGNWGPWYAEITPGPSPDGYSNLYRVEFVRDDKGILRPITGPPYDSVAFIETEAIKPIYARTMRQARRIARAGLRYRRRRDAKLQALSALSEKVIVL